MSIYEMPSVPLATFALAAIIIALIAIRRIVVPAAPRNKAKPLLSEWERRSLAGLRQAIPAGWHVCPQVRVADFLSAEGGTRKTRWMADARTRQRSVDFLLIDAAASPRLVIELDDATHSRPERRRRDHQNDTAYEQAGVPVKHVRPGRLPDWTALVAQVTTHSAQAAE